jgi:hypothetical protein
VAGRGAAPRRTRSAPSAGLPAQDLPPGDRIAELEERLARLEGGPGYRERGRHLMNRVMPADASQHFRNAGREQLLGIRSIVDFWIRRIDDAEEHATSNHSRPESIDVE